MCGKGGSTSPTGPVILKKGDSVTFKIRPDQGEDLRQAIINDIDVTAECRKTDPYSYTVESVTGDFLLKVFFTSSSYIDPVGKEYVSINKGKPEFVLVDVRPREYFDGEKTMVPGATAGHIPGAINVPKSAIEASSDAELASVGITRDKTVIVYCNKGVTSPQAAAILEQRGFSLIKDYSGGMADWGGDSRKAVSMKPIEVYLSDGGRKIVSLDVSSDACVRWVVENGALISLSPDRGSIVEVEGQTPGIAKLSAYIDGQARAMLDISVKETPPKTPPKRIKGCNLGFSPLAMLLMAPLFAFIRSE